MAFFSRVIPLTSPTLRHAFLNPLGQRLRSYLNIIRSLFCRYEHPNHNLGLYDVLYKCVSKKGLDVFYFLSATNYQLLDIEIQKINQFQNK